MYAFRKLEKAVRVFLHWRASRSTKICRLKPSKEKWLFLVKIYLMIFLKMYGVSGQIVWGNIQWKVIIFVDLGLGC